MGNRSEYLSWRRVLAYNLKRKPWRTAGRLSRSLNRRGKGPRCCLCAIILLEITVLGVREPGTFGWLWEDALHIDRKSESLRETEVPGLEENSAMEKKDSGITIDWKKGRIEFWKTEEAIRPDEAVHPDETIRPEYGG